MRRSTLNTIARGAALVSLLPVAACGEAVHDVLLGPSTQIAEQTPPPVPAPSPSPTPAAAPLPAPTPEPEPSDDIPPYLPNNTAPVAKVTARVFFVELNGSPIMGSEYSTEVPVGARLHLDCTPRDAYGQPTRAAGGPYWSINVPSLVTGGSRTAYSPAWLVKAPGTFVASVEIDGQRSNDVVVRFY